MFFYENNDERFTLTFPDTWKRVENQKPDDEITIAGPGDGAYVSCRMRVRKDRRFVVYPGKFDSDIQKVAYSGDFWDTYLGEYDQVVLDYFKDESGLGLGYASLAEVSYETVEGPILRKKAVIFASLYHDRAYIAECSAHESAFLKWHPVFLSIVKSVDFGKVRHPKRQGHYRTFTDKDEEIEVLGPEKLDGYKL